MGGRSSTGSRNTFPTLESANRIVYMGQGTNHFKADNGDGITVSYNRNSQDYELRIMPNRSLKSEVVIPNGSIHEIDVELRRRYHIGLEEDRGSNGGKATDLSNRTAEQLDKLYESAAASKDRELMKSVLEELSRRPQEESQQSYAYSSKNTRRRGTRGRR